MSSVQDCPVGGKNSCVVHLQGRPLPSKIGSDPLVSPLHSLSSFLLILQSPRKDDGEPVTPSQLIDHINSQGWETNPNCFCSIWGKNCVVVLYIPRASNSPAYQQVSLVCPEFECPYSGMFGVPHILH